MAETRMTRNRVSFADPLSPADPNRAADPRPDVWVSVPDFIEPTEETTA